MNSAIIVAAGQGKRFGSETPKQFLHLGDKPLIFHTLEKFQSCSLIDEIILVLAEDKIDFFHSLEYRSQKALKLAVGGKTRAESVFNGFQLIDERTEIVAVHDGARPFVSVEEISKTVQTAQKHGAACLVAPINETVKRVSQGKIVETVDRCLLRRALTPQAFKREILARAFENASLDETVTDECFLVEKTGVEIAIVEGSLRNIKITTSEDWALAQIFLKEETKLEEEMKNVSNWLRK